MDLDLTVPGVVLSPHPDDAVLSAWSLLRSPGEVQVVDVCTALPPPGTLGSFDPVFGATDSHELMRARLAEDEEALAHAGRTAVHLDSFDDQYRSGPLVVADLAAAIAPIVEGAGWIAAPAGIGAHPDHVAVRDAALALVGTHGAALVLYADLPYAIWAGWPHWVTGLPPRPHLVPDARWTADLASVAAAVPDHDLVARPQALSPTEQAAKLAALRCYETQFAALDAGPLGRLTNPEVIGFELCWWVRPDPEPRR